MGYEERFKAIEARLGALEKRLSPEGSLESGQAAFAGEAGKPWSPAIPNTIDEVPKVGNIHAEKLMRIRIGNREFWAAAKDEGRQYAEVVPGDPTHCKNVPGTFDLESSFHRTPEGAEILRKEYNEWYLEKRPAPKCRRVSGSWDLEPIS